jgi:hypothetical protein
MGGHGAEPKEQNTQQSHCSDRRSSPHGGNHLRRKRDVHPFDNPHGTVRQAAKGRG